MGSEIYYDMPPTESIAPERRYEFRNRNENKIKEFFFKLT